MRTPDATRTLQIHLNSYPILVLRSLRWMFLSHFFSLYEPLVPSPKMLWGPRQNGTAVVVICRWYDFLGIHFLNEYLEWTNTILRYTAQQNRRVVYYYYYCYYSWIHFAPITSVRARWIFAMDEDRFLSTPPQNRITYNKSNNNYYYYYFARFILSPPRWSVRGENL